MFGTSECICFVYLTNGLCFFPRHGFGCLELASGLRYNGEWYLDRPQGKGMLIYPDGSILKGYFAGGLCEGSFTHYSSSGHVDLLDFRRGCLVKSEPLRQMNYCEGKNLGSFGSCHYFFYLSNLLS